MSEFSIRVQTDDYTKEDLYNDFQLACRPDTVIESEWQETEVFNIEI